MTYQPKVNDVFCEHLKNFPVFYQIIKVSKTGKSVTIREINDTIVKRENSQNYYSPKLNEFKGEEQRKRVDCQNKIISFSNHGGVAFLFEQKSVAF